MKPAGSTPSLETLEKVLETLGCDLNDLHNAIQIINGRPEKMKRRGEGMGGEEGAPPGGGESSPVDEGGRTALQRVLGRSEALPVEEERAFTEMLDGFHRLLRYFHETFSRERKRREGDG